jgi:hypothetical protein
MNQKRLFLWIAVMHQEFIKKFADAPITRKVTGEIELYMA